MYMAQLPWLFYSPLLISLCLPFVSPFTYLAPSSCDRNCPPRSQVACELTPFAPPFTQPTPSLQIPRTPTAQRLTKTTSGIFRLLLSGTILKHNTKNTCKNPLTVFFYLWCSSGGMTRLGLERTSSFYQPETNIECVLVMRKPGIWVPTDQAKK
jgi:hypothetical protein